MAFSEFQFPSANGQDTVWGWRVTPLGTPKAAVQLIHGYGEHSRRYLHMALAFAEAGIAVYADDHIGHGKTGLLAGRLGDPYAKTFEDYTKDELTLFALMKKELPDVPKFLLGQSWGSMLARDMASQVGKELAGLLLTGLVADLPRGAAILADPAFQADLADHPHEANDGWFDSIFDGMLDRFGPGAAAEGRWIAVDQRILEDDANDPFSCWQTCMELTRDFMQLHVKLERMDWISEIPETLPVYLMGGSEDPCGNFGEGIRKTAVALKKHGNPVTARIWDGWRHEVHNEPSIKAQVEAELVAYILSQA
ncbi:MAG: alpha/beta fold hydrolase [Firmicutes bacterium]|nr:alpha/beta fold hydrolase [Bacillota bacterium]